MRAFGVGVGVWMFTGPSEDEEEQSTRLKCVETELEQAETYRVAKARCIRKSCVVIVVAMIIAALVGLVFWAFFGATM